MHFGNPIVPAIFAALAVVVGVWIALRFFSADARRERRRRRSNRPVSTRANRPMVKFSVRTKKDRRK
jgi:hypothetical protein